MISRALRRVKSLDRRLLRGLILLSVLRGVGWVLAFSRHYFPAPDLADAFALTFARDFSPLYAPEVVDRHRRDRHRYWEQPRDPWSFIPRPQ